MSRVSLDPQAVIADLDELAAQSGGRFAGAKRLAWTPEWMQAREWLTAKLTESGLDLARDNIKIVPGSCADIQLLAEPKDNLPPLPQLPVLGK